MPIINSYSVIGSGGGSGGTSNSEPYPFSIVKIISIPANQKFLLVPGKEHPREITLGFNSEPIDLYFGSDEVSFISINVGKRYRDTQLGVDLYVFSSVACEALVIVRSTEIINYIGEQPTPEPDTNWAIIAPDGLSVLIDSSKFPNNAISIDASVIVPDYQSITNYQFFSSLEWRDQDGYFINSYSGYPTNPGDFIATINNSHSSINFRLTSEYDWAYLKISQFDLNTSTFTLINPPPQEWLFIASDSLTAAFDGSQLTPINSWNLAPRQVKVPWLIIIPSEWSNDLSRVLVAERKVRSTGQLNLFSWTVKIDSIMQFELNFNFHESVKFYVNRRINVNGTLTTIKSDYLKIIDFNFLTNTFTLEA